MGQHQRTNRWQRSNKGRNWRWQLAGLIVLLLSASMCFARPGGTKGKGRSDDRTSTELEQLVAAAQNTPLANEKLEVIVQFRARPTRLERLRMTNLGGTYIRHLRLIRGEVFDLPLSAIAQMAEDPDVLYISPNRSVSGAADYAEQTVGANIEQAAGWDGTGIGVAVIDSGISDHPDLHDPATGLSRVVYSETFVPGTDTRDGYGHGTHVAGIIAGNGSKSNGLIFGVAPHVNLINLKVLDSNGAGQDSYVIAALQRAGALKTTYNIRVVNLSLGRSVYESFTQDPLCQAVEAAWNAGLVVVAAAGNWGRNNTQGINGYGTVGAMNTRNSPSKSDDQIATYSSKGPSPVDHVVKPDLVAPGNKMRSLLVSGSTLDKLMPFNEVFPLTYGVFALPSYFTLSGTSMATPVVSGAAALMLQQNSALSPDTVKGRLMKTADKTFPSQSTIFDRVTGLTYTEQYDIFTVGAGYLNIPAAMGNNDPVQGASFSTVAVENADGTISLETNLSALFGNSVIWGNSVVWRNSVIWGNSV